MNKTAIKNFAMWARNKLIADISYKAGLLGVTEKGIKSPLPQSTQTVQFFDIGTKEPSSVAGVEIQQRKRLVEEIERKAKQSDYVTAYKNVLDEVAYTWFNRLIAIRFMEVNDYLPTRIRVLSSESIDKAEPDLVTYALEASFDYSAYEKDRIIQLKHENKLDELFRMLFIKQCNALNTNLPELFEKTSDYTELLLNVSFTDKEGVVYHLVHDIKEDDFNINKEGQVEIIGWLYQYYNEERKNEVINIYKGTVKKDDIPAATQLFTTDWVVRYMVDNSLGRYWIERNPNSRLSEKLRYLVKPNNGKMRIVNENILPQELTIFDPCMGSGHILVYAFDVLMEIYRENGYAERDAAQMIVNNNLFGLDIDNRAYQLAYFAVMMKARSYDRRFFNKNIEPNLSAILETNEIPRFYAEGITRNINQIKIGEYLVQSFKDAKEIGSLLNIEKLNYQEFRAYLNECDCEGQISIENTTWLNLTRPLLHKIAHQAIIMSNKYNIVCTNPPYMNKFDGMLKKHISENYVLYNGDFFSVFIVRSFEYCNSDGYIGFMTPYVWMFIKTYEDLRELIINTKSIKTLVQMEYSAFEEATVPICSFVLGNSLSEEPGQYIDLTSYKGGMSVQNTKLLETLKFRTKDLYEAYTLNFKFIPGKPIAYLANEQIINIYKTSKVIGEVASVKKGLATGNVDLFIKYWYEVDLNKISFNTEINTWYPCHKGGGFRKWYGNFEKIINWENNGDKIKNYTDENGRLKSRPQNLNYMFKKGIVFSKITSGGSSCRIMTGSEMFDDAVQGIFANNDDEIYNLMAILNSKIIAGFLKFINPTLNKQIYDLERIAVINSSQEIKLIVGDLISVFKEDWDDYETSWNFSGHFLASQNVNSISEAFNLWESYKMTQFNKAKKLEEQINEILISEYKLDNYITPDVNDDQISITRSNVKDDVKGLISYFVGCILGRYQINNNGLLFAGGKWNDDIINSYAVSDNIVPITDDEYFENDIVGLFFKLIKNVYGDRDFDRNISFIADALGNKGQNSRETIRYYFLKEFYKDHCMKYQQRPIYWLFDSGKKNGFKALIYMHRYDENTIGNLRIDYLHRMQRIYENEIARMQDTIENSRDAREVTAATKRKEKLIKQLQETKEYDEKIAHLALARTLIDLDDGVKVNYEKVQTDRDGKKLDVLAKI